MGTVGLWRSTCYYNRPAPWTFTALEPHDVPWGSAARTKPVRHSFSYNDSEMLIWKLG